jgi:hypothetical protein
VGWEACGERGTTVKRDDTKRANDQVCKRPEVDAAHPADRSERHFGQRHARNLPRIAADEIAKTQACSMCGGR